MVSSLEIAAIAGALGGAAWLMHRQRAGVTGWVLAGLAVAGAGTGAALHHGTLDARALNRAQVLAEVPKLERDADGFVSSDTCEACHPKQYETWHDSYHRTMTQLADGHSVLGEFDGITLHEGEYEYHLSQDDRGYFVEMVDFEWERKHVQTGGKLGAMASRQRVKKRIVMTTGSHVMQTYWYPSSDGNELLNFPFVWLNPEEGENEGRWAPRSDVFMRPPEAQPMRQRWNDNCLGCHTTFGQPLRAKDGFNTAVAELGIACEACHGPAEKHIEAHRNPLDRYFTHLQGGAPDPTIVNPARLSAARASEVCAQCHSKSWINDFNAFNDHGLAFRPGDELAKSKTIVSPIDNPDHPWLKQSVKRDPRFLDQFFWSDGMIRVSGRDYNGMAASECFGGGELSCLTCHSLHDGDRNMHMPQGDVDAPCETCHAPIAAKLSEHTHHPQGEGSRCVNCHMPYTVYGLMKGIRSHLISNPSAQETLETGRANACNGCHLDKTLAWTAERLKQWYGKTPPAIDGDAATVSAFVLAMTEGDAGERALAAWAAGWEPAKAASGDDWLAPYLAALLDDPYSTVRYVAARSLRRLSGYEDFTYDFVGPGRSVQEDRARQRWTAPTSANPATLMTGSGIDDTALSRHRARRDDRPMDLKE